MSVLPLSHRINDYPPSLCLTWSLTLDCRCWWDQALSWTQKPAGNPQALLAAQIMCLMSFCCLELTEVDRFYLTSCHKHNIHKSIWSGSSAKKKSKVYFSNVLKQNIGWNCDLYTLCAYCVCANRETSTHTQRQCIITRTLKYMRTGTFIRTVIHRNKATEHSFSMRVVFFCDRHHWRSDKVELNIMQMRRNTAATGKMTCFCPIY